MLLENLVLITNNPKERRVKNKGKPIPLGNITLQESGNSKRTLLNLESVNPQLWPRVLDVWKDSILNSYLRGNFEYSAKEMFEYLSIYLIGTAKAIWETYKLHFPNEYLEMKIPGPNPYNESFVTKLVN